MRLSKSIHSPEWAVALGATLLVIVLHGEFLWHAGGLWRDEVTTFNLAARPSFHEVWRGVWYDSFPGVIHFILHFWQVLGFGDSDFGTRCLGFLFGVVLL